MISVEMTTALMLYFGLVLLALCIIWLCTNFRKKPGIPPVSMLTNCEYCHYTFLAKTGQPVSKCPQCGSLNKAS